MNGTACQRDIDGFCVCALAGNPRCFRGRGANPCVETSAAEARKHTVDALLRREAAVRGEPERRAER
jgi:hypothetical protein